MCLNDSLQICLLALDSRFPRHRVDINKAALEIYDVERCTWLEMRGWMVREIIATLAQAAPALLRSPALLLLEGCNSAIYLPEYSRMEPAFYLHCPGIMMLKIEYLEW
jgi:hypothetical protein